MYQLDWAARDRWNKEKRVAPTESSTIALDQVNRVLLLNWEEHCIECSVPECYATCLLFAERSDRKCARFVYGIYPNPAFRGLHSFGADIRFRRWGKLETEVSHFLLSMPRYRVFHALNRAITNCVNPVASLLAPVNPKRRLNGALTYTRMKFLRRISNTRRTIDIDEFVLECYSPNADTIRLILECRNTDYPYRHAFEINPGWNVHRLPANLFHLSDFPQTGRITLSVDEDREARLIFTWLDFVRYDRVATPNTTAQAPASLPTAETGPAAKVKCIAWDLDNTLWSGTLIEDKADGIKLNETAVTLIRELDRRGIVQSVVSKNNFDDAWSVLQKHKLDEYFLFPEIHWGQKSVSLRRIADNLNIHINTLALIDDSAFERAEVQSALTEVRVYTEQQIGTLLELDEFDMPITEASENRRISYQQESHRKKHLSTFDDDYESFLRSCQLEMFIFRPCEETQIVRCLELIQRTNQLNLSGQRLSRDELNGLMSDNKMLMLAIRCRDRFGDYGLVGFAVVDERGDEPMLAHFCLSCRVAQKRVEHTFLKWLAGYEQSRGRSSICANLVRSKRNGPLLQVFDDLPFHPHPDSTTGLLLQLTIEEAPELGDIIAVQVADNITPEGINR